LTLRTVSQARQSARTVCHDSLPWLSALTVCIDCLPWLPVYYCVQSGACVQTVCRDSPTNTACTHQIIVGLCRNQCNLLLLSPVRTLPEIWGHHGNHVLDVSRVARLETGWEGTVMLCFYSWFNKMYNIYTIIHLYTEIYISIYV